MKKYLGLLLALLLALSVVSGLAEASGTVVVYSPHDANPLNAGVALFEKKHIPT